MGLYLQILEKHDKISMRYEVLYSHMLSIKIPSVFQMEDSAYTGRVAI